VALTLSKVQSPNFESTTRLDLGVRLENESHVASHSRCVCLICLLINTFCFVGPTCLCLPAFRISVFEVAVSLHTALYLLCPSVPNFALDELRQRRRRNTRQDEAKDKSDANPKTLKPYIPKDQDGKTKTEKTSSLSSLRKREDFLSTHTFSKSHNKKQILVSCLDYCAYKHQDKKDSQKNHTNNHDWF
jgi:hypothetical protein